MAAVFLAYLAVAQFSSYLYQGVGAYSTVILAPVGVAFAAVILEGYSILPAVALAALMSGLLSGSSPIVIAGSVVGNTLQPLIAYFILKRIGFDRMLGRVRDMFAIVMVGLFGSMIVPTIGVYAADIDTILRGVPYTTPWVSRWLGGAVSMLVLAPFLIRWISRPFTPRTWVQICEAVGGTALLVLTSYSYFLTTHGTFFGIPLIVCIIAILFWIAFRSGPRFMTLSLALLTFISMLGALYGPPVFPESSLAERIYNTQVLDLLLAVFFFILVSIEEQRKEAVRKLSSQNVDLRATVSTIHTETEAKNEFIATLAHELRNPLASLLSSVEVLRLSVPLDFDAAKGIELMESQIKNMSSLLDDLLDISRITQRKFELKKSTVNVTALIRRSVDVAMPLIRRRRHHIEVSLSSHDVVAEVDPLRIEQIVVNLLHNAAKYTPEGGRITVSAVHTDGTLSIVVSDTGIGIPEDRIAHIFEPFMQIRNPGGMSGGIGIGLALTKNLVEMHGGTIAVRRAVEGVGTQFEVRIPAHDQRRDAVADTIPETPYPSAVTGHLQLLIVDDNVGAAESMARLLTLCGHRVQTVYRGEEVVRTIIEDGPFDAVLLDVGLPDIDGYEVATRIRISGSQVVLIGLSGYGQQEDRERAESAGFDHYLIKPAGREILEQVLSTVQKLN